MGNHRIRRLERDGTILTVAGSGEEGDSGDGGSALNASFSAPSGLTLLPDGRLLIADRAAHRVRSLNLDGTVSAYNPGTTLKLRRPGGLAADAYGTVAIADESLQQVLQGSTDGNSVLAGSGEEGAFQGSDPSSATLDGPAMVAVNPQGDLAVGDRHNHQVQRLSLAALAFGTVPAGSTSAAQTLTLQNGSSAALQVLALELPADFILTSGSTCMPAPFTLPGKASCTATISFAPAAQGSADGVARVRIHGAAPRLLRLSGSGTAGGTLAGSNTALRSDGSVAYAGSPVTLTATVAGSLLQAPSGTVTFIDGATPMSAAPVVNAVATFTFTGLQTGQHTLQAVYNGDSVYRSSSSTGLNITVVPTPDFTLAAGAKSYSGKAGGSIVIPLTMVPINGTLNRVVQFAASGLPFGATAVFSPATLTLGGDTMTVTLTVQLPVSTALQKTGRGSYVVVGCILLLAVPRVRSRRPATLFALVVCCACTTILYGCGSGFRAGVSEATLTGASSQTSVAVITATTTGVLGSTLAHSSSIALVVTK